LWQPLQVYLWSLTVGDEKAGEDPLSAELRSTLKDYSHDVSKTVAHLSCPFTSLVFTMQ